MSFNEFKIGEFVVYGTNGVCRIEDITMRTLSPSIPPRRYYILTQIKNSSTIYVPCESQIAKMRYPVSAEQIIQMLAESKHLVMPWNLDRKARTARFHEILTAGVGVDLLLMIRCIKTQKDELAKSKKKLSNTDSDLLFTAQSILEDEFSFVLGIPAHEVKEYIDSSLAQEVACF